MISVLVDVRGNDRASGFIEQSMHFPCIYGSSFFSTVQEVVGKLAGEPLVVSPASIRATGHPHALIFIAQTLQKSSEWQSSGSA